MCGNAWGNVLPIAGAVIGSVIPGFGTAAGAAIGGAIGGAVNGGLVQGGGLTGALEGGVTGGVGGYFGGGSLGGLFDAGAGSAFTGAGFDMGSAAAGNMMPDLGSVEGGMGGSALFGPGAGTGTVLGNAASSVGAGNLGIAGTETGLGGMYPMDMTSTLEGNQQFLGGLGGGYGGTGLNPMGQGASDASLGAMGGMNSSGIGGTNPNGTSASGAPGGAASVSGNPTASTPTTPTMSTQASGVVGQNTGAGIAQTNAPVNAGTGTSLEGGQAAPSATSGSGAPYGYGPAVGGYDNGAAAATGGGNLSTMYGPSSTAAGSPAGSSISSSGGALGEAKMGDDGLANLFGGGYSPGQAAGMAGGMPGSQLSPWFGLAKAGMGAYQQYAQQQANNQYRNQIQNIFSPTGAYAQQMQSNLARQYAARGMNAEKGPQQVQLAALLAQNQAQALGNSNYAQAATATPGASMLNSLFSNYAQNPGGWNNMVQSGWNGLQGLFS